MRSIVARRSVLQITLDRYDRRGPPKRPPLAAFLTDLRGDGVDSTSRSRRKLNPGEGYGLFRQPVSARCAARSPELHEHVRRTRFGLHGNVPNTVERFHPLTHALTDVHPMEPGCEDHMHRHRVKTVGDTPGV
jgi:hypothetical protein